MPSIFFKYQAKRHLVGWNLVATRSECGGSEINLGVAYDGRPLTFDIEYCADRCKGISSMFAFGTNDYGNPRCYTENKYPNKGCNCLCETGAKSDGTCSHSSHSGYRLYRYEKGKME